jgi:MoaA/NifB/PqqE/SkfB family radical SAM enzyme
MAGAIRKPLEVMRGRVKVNQAAALRMRNVPTSKLSRLSVEYNLTEHCNLSCYACDHASPLLPIKFASVEEFSRDFEALASVFHSRQLRFVGGEPLLHPQLLEFLSEARRIGIADTIVLITNGVLLHQVRDEFWELIDELWVSEYPGVNRKLDDTECAEICKAHNVLFRHWRVKSFNRTIINNRIDKPDLVRAIFRNCKLAGEISCHTVHEGRFYKCSVAPFMGPRLALKGIAFDNRTIDGVSLHSNSKLFEDLDRCLNGTTPLAACSYCLGSLGPLVTHRQLNRDGRLQWLEEDNGADVEAIRKSWLVKWPVTSSIVMGLCSGWQKMNRRIMKWVDRDRPKIDR